MKTPVSYATRMLVLSSAACLVANPVLAASSWLSTVTTIENGLHSTTPADVLASAPTVSSSSATSVFNLAISIEENPAGDDDYAADPGAADDAQNKFEKKIEQFADAVYQATNGKHKIGTVTFFRSGKQANNADVVWIENCPEKKGPRANPSGFGKPGKHIKFCTNWPGAPNLMDTPKGAGYTLAHEWGHYAYGLYDEYAANCGQVPETGCPIFFPRSTDTVASPSIMHNQWTAASSSGNDQWLEFSTSGVEPFKSNASGDNRNAQARVFSEPAWDTLVRDSSSDPKHAFLPERTQYTNLVAPTGTNLLVNDDVSSARSELKIVWAGNQVVELMIDTSGSMGADRGKPIQNAISAGQLLVGQLTPGQSAVGVGRFTSRAYQPFPIEDIPNPDTDVRKRAQATIGGFKASGLTDIENAALVALDEVKKFDGGKRPSVVFLLSDGVSSVNENRVIDAYKNARVPLITFGFGNGVRADLLQRLAKGTNGNYFFSPTSLAEIQQAFVAAKAAVSSSVVVSSSTSASAASAVSLRKIELDSTLKIATVTVSFPGPATDVDLRLLDASGADTGASFTCGGGAEISCTAEVDVAAKGAGQYTVEVKNKSGAEKKVSVLVAGTPSKFENFDMAVAFNNAKYPASFAITSVVRRGDALTGLDVVAEVTAPDGKVIKLPMKDDGRNADLVADDGEYSVDVPYKQDGTYSAVVRASNPNGKAQTTFNGMAVALGENGQPITPKPTAVTESFTRVALATAEVKGVALDDHSDEPTQPAGCTAIMADNADTAGRIDRAGDVDCFFVTPRTAGKDLVVRASALREDMKPQLRVLDSTGKTEIAKATLASSANDESGVVVTIPAASVSTKGHVITIEHQYKAASKGSYAVSAGEQLASDVKDTTPTPPKDQKDPEKPAEPTGGAVGPLGMLIAALLAVVGLRQRRRQA